MTSQLEFASSVQPERLQRREWLLAWGAALLAGALHVALATQRGLWCDEYLTLIATQKDLAGLCADRLDAGHSPLYFIFARLGYLFGIGERAVRSTSALSTVAMVLGLSGAAGAMGLRRWLPLIWGAALLQPYWISMGTMMRYMMPLLAVTAFALWAVCLYAAEPTWRRGAVLALVLALLLWLHASAQFFLVALAVFLLWDGYRSGDGRLRLALAGRLWPLGAGLVASLPLLYLIRGHRGSLEAGQPGWGEFKSNLLEVVFGYHRIWTDYFHVSGQWVYYLEFALLGVAVWLTWRVLRREGRLRAWRLLASLMAVTPLMLYLFCALVRNFSGPSRYFMVFSLPAALCLAVACRAEGAARPWQLRLYQAALALLLAAQALGAAIDRDDRFRDASRWIMKHYTGHEKVLVSSARLVSAGLKFYGFKNDGDLIKVYGSCFESNWLYRKR
jgi:hypothetical protein